jgi:hypothetical protein
MVAVMLVAVEVQYPLLPLLLLLPLLVCSCCSCLVWSHAQVPANLHCSLVPAHHQSGLHSPWCGGSPHHQL